MLNFPTHRLRPSTSGSSSSSIRRRQLLAPATTSTSATPDKDPRRARHDRRELERHLEGRRQERRQQHIRVALERRGKSPDRRQSSSQLEDISGHNRKIGRYINTQA